jgi:uncharacterized protein
MVTKALLTVALLLISNFFMTIAWYGHLQFKKWNVLHDTGLMGIILISWAIALLEYIFMVPANRIGSATNGGPFDLFQLKIIQEVITLVVFVLCAIFVFKTDSFRWNHLAAFN